MSFRPRHAVRRALTALVPVTALLSLAACGNDAAPTATDASQGAADPLG